MEKILLKYNISKMQVLFKGQDRVLTIIIGIAIALFIFFSFGFSKGNSFLLLNAFHSKALDLFFTYYTFLGDGLFSVLLVIGLFFLRKKLLAFQLLIAFLVSGGMAQLIKKAVPAPRPKAFFEEGIYHHFINGVTHSGMNSFPSGHTASAFAIAMLLCLHTKKPALQLLYFLLACMVAFSRVYLGQHFVMDTFMGAVLGITISMLTFAYIKLPRTAKSLSRRQLSPFSVE